MFVWVLVFTSGSVKVFHASVPLASFPTSCEFQEVVGVAAIGAMAMAEPIPNAGWP